MKVSKDHIVGAIVTILVLAVLIYPFYWGYNINKRVKVLEKMVNDVGAAHNNLVNMVMGKNPNLPPLPEVKPIQPKSK